MYFRAQRKSAQYVSLSEWIETGADGTPLELMDVISQEGSLLDQISDREQVGKLRQAIATALTGQEREVILRRYGLEGRRPQRQREVAQAMGISRSYVSRIEKRGLEKLRRVLQDRLD